MAKHNELGNLGEAYAADYLVAKGFQILARNWRNEKAEIDLIGKQGNLLVFFEVKTRSADSFGRPIEFISQHKQHKLIEAAEAYLENLPEEQEIRFDVVEVLFRNGVVELNHIEGAFRDGI